MAERRSTSVMVELRAGKAGRMITGYALLYNRYSQNLGGYVEQCAPGLADKSIADGADVLCRFQHDSDMLLGRVSSGTCRVSSDELGVAYEADLPDTGYASDLAALAARGDVRHSSFAFRCVEDEWDFTEQGFPLRTLLAVQLVDVAPVVTPAYLDTVSALRSLAERRGLDVDAVTRAAAAGGLGDLLRESDPVVIDLGERRADKTPDGDTDPAGQRCDCCPDCADAEDQCPGCECGECRGCKAKRSSGVGAQRATHAPIAVRRLQLELARKAL